jgi:hypothetical protein
MPNGNAKPPLKADMVAANAAAARSAAITASPAYLHRVVLNPAEAISEQPVAKVDTTKLVERSLLATPNIAQQHSVQLIDPNLFRAIERFRTPEVGQPRSALHLPTLISNVAVPTDQTLFEDPDNPAKHYWLGGGFQIATRVDGATSSEWVELRPGDNGVGFTLDVNLSPHPPGVPPVGAELVPAGAVTTRFFLRATVQGMVRQWDFPSVAVTGRNWNLRLQLDGEDALVQLHLIYRAMTESPDAKLIIRRSLMLAVPSPPVIVSSGEGVLRGTYLFSFDTGAETSSRSASDVWWEQQTNVERQLVPDGIAKIVNLGVGDFDSITLDDLRGRAYGRAPICGNANASNQLVVGDVFAVQTLGHNYAKVQVLEYAYNLKLRWVTYAALPVYRVAETAVDSPVDFAFSKDLDKGVFAKLTTDVGPTASGWNHYKVLWQPKPDTPGTFSYYFQDRSQPFAIYFLPDEFRIQRRPESPHRPWLNLTVLDDGAKMSLGYIAVPVWDGARVAAAVAELKKQGAPPALQSLYPFPAGNAHLRLKLPKGDPSGGPGFVDQPTASVQTESAINGNVTLPVDDFKAVFDALVNDDSDLLSGFVDVTVDSDKMSIPFTVRASHFAGSLFDVETAADAASGGIKVTVRNAIESPIRVDALPVTLLREGQPVATRVVSTAPALPATIAAGPDGKGGTVEVVVTAQDGAAGDAKVLCDFSKVQVLPDSNALLDTILDPAIQGHAARDVTVNVPAVVFTPPPPASGGAAPPAPLAIQVEFEVGPTAATFVAPPHPEGSPLLTQVVHLRLPLHDFLLGQLAGTASRYRYRVRVIFATGDKVGDLQTDSIDQLFIAVPVGNG